MEKIRKLVSSKFAIFSLGFIVLPIYISKATNEYILVELEQ